MNKKFKMDLLQFQQNILNIINNLNPKWNLFFNKLVRKQDFHKLIEKLYLEYLSNDVYPKLEKLFQVFQLCSPDEIKVVILGQDPYPTPHMANGIAFAVDENFKIPGSLKNIFQELENCSLKHKNLKYLDLKKWVNQGVFLINTVLTVKAYKPNSHINLGWDFFIYELFSFFKENYQDIIYVGFGRSAQNIIINHKIDPKFYLFTSHPSPLSCYKNISSNIPAFLGSNVFNKINQKLTSINKENIDFYKK